MMLKVIFFGNSQSVFSNGHFQALLDAPCALVGVVDAPPGKRSSTNPQSDTYPPFTEAARQRGVPSFEPPGPNQPAFIAAVGNLAPDLFIAAGYMGILKEAILAVPRMLAANFHASLLPDYRGKHPVFWTLRAGEKWAGLTVHAMDPGIDTGDILYQVRVRTRRDDSVASLYDRIMARSVGLVGRLVADAQRGSIPGQPQPPGEGSYHSSTSPDDFRIDWRWPAEKIRRYVASTPGQCFADVQGRQLFLAQAESMPGPERAAPGTLLKLGRKRAVVAAGLGAISLGMAHQAAALAQPAAALLRELGFAPGDCLIESESTDAARGL